MNTKVSSEEFNDENCLSYTYHDITHLRNESRVGEVGKGTKVRHDSQKIHAQVYYHHLTPSTFSLYKSFS